ncbi:MAG: aminodeoxychorismate lyase [Anaerolineae bacterium]|nr:MAG: aminodeoxychorismate lyase [Anaerolineae bacterium]
MHQRDITRGILALIFTTLLGILLVTCVVGGGLYLWARQEGLNPLTAIRLRVALARHQDVLTSPAGADPQYRRFEVRPGDTAYTIAYNLYDAGLITDPDLFVDYVRYYRLDNDLEAGTYFLQQTRTLEEIAYALTDASSASLTFGTLPGWRLEEVAQNAVGGNPLLSFGPTEFMAVVTPPGATFPPGFKERFGIPDVLSNGQPPSLEGFMFPGEYKLPPDVTPSQLVEAMLTAFNQAITDEMIQRAAQQGLTFYQALTLASIVQREAVAPDEAPVIASVYLNRLRRSMKLDADPTVQYAIGFRDGTWWPRLSGEADYYALGVVQANAAYNTYLKRDGAPLSELLPPGPICSPGLAAINAVLNPAQTEYLYFRSCDDLRHIFTMTLEEHSAVACP